jgi:5-methylcytosine-specific restriction endonuclease McrA
MVLRRHMKRAKEARVAVIKRVDAFAIFNRDKWICQICREPAPQGLYGLNLPTSPEIDHVRSFRLGGFNTPENMRCVHNACQKIKNLDVDAAWAAVYDKKTGKWVGLADLLNL